MKEEGGEVGGKEEVEERERGRKGRIRGRSLR
jgi:hypothetical protein